MSSFQPIRDLIARVRRRWRLLVALRSSARTGLAVSTVVAVAVLAAFIGGASAAVLAVVAAVAAMAVIAALAWGLSPIREVPSDARVARYIEERDASLNDSLVSAAEMANAAGVEPATPVSSLFATDVIRRAADVDTDAIVPSRVVRRAGLQAAASILLVASLIFFARGIIRRGADALSLTLFPSSVTLEVTPGHVRLPAGSPLTIEARLMGNSAPVVASVLRADADGDVPAADWTPAEMTVNSDGGFALVLEKIEKPFRYRVAAGSIQSDVFEVQIAHPPRVERIDVEYAYPGALRLPARIERDSGDIYAPAGTEVRIHVHAEGPVSSGSMTLAGGHKVALTSGPEGLVSEPLKIVEDGSYRVALSGADGLTNPGDTEYFIRMLEDRPPDVHVLRPARDRAVTSLEEVEIEAEAEDDHGVDRLELVMTVRGGPERVVPLQIAQGETAVSGRHTLYLEDLDLSAGDFISYYVRARDVARGKRPSIAKSDIFFLEVKPFEQEFTLARSQGAGMGGSNRSVDDLVAAQKEIIVATWKLDRRAEAAARGAQSAQDIRAVARAESELKTRVERTSSSFRDQTMRDPRRAQPGPGQPPRPAAPPAPQPRAGQTLPEEDAMTQAARAMGVAVTALERLQTDDALAPEMEALNHLLRAQADVKRREVMRQQASGGAGQNRTSQDLSSLFDRELQRQQQTNYETPTTTEQRDSEDGMLDRIRDLARRQDEVLRQQQELARRRSQMTEEQIKRELERLTREQTELRQRAEEMARQLDRSERQQGQQGGRQNQQGARQNQQGGGQRGQQPTGQSQQGAGESQQSTGRGQRAAPSQSASERMRQASEAMAAAAGDLRREDARQATASGGRALQQLQELQQQMQAALPDERRRAMGDMQLEARQMADEQRRIAAQDANAGNGGQAADTRRRLAGEQNRLADRLRRLQSGLDQQAAAPASDPQNRTDPGDRAAGQARRDAARDASREIERQRLTERMEQSADEMRGADRDGSQGGRQAQREQEDLARALERLADRIASGVTGADPQSQRATEQLTRAQDLRERIESLTREAERLSQQSGATGSAADGARLRDEYQRQLQETRELLDQIGRDNPEVRRGGMGFTFAGQGMVTSAPGTEPFKQDFAKWDELRKQVTLALDLAATELSRKLQARDARDRLAAGADDKPPASYQQQVDSYFKALAEKKTP
jgi:hypothetical protein